MLIKGDNKNRDKRNIGIVTDLYPGADGEVRAVKLPVGNKVYEEPYNIYTQWNYLVS